MEGYEGVQEASCLTEYRQEHCVEVELGWWGVVETWEPW